MVVLFGLILVLVCFGLIIADMERRRRQLSAMLDRFEPLVGRDRRFHIRNLRAMNGSLFYASHLMENFEREVAALEQAKGVQPADREARFSLRTGLRFRDLEARVDALAALAGPANPDAPSDRRGADAP